VVTGRATPQAIQLGTATGARMIIEISTLSEIDKDEDLDDRPGSSGLG
jgi:hypothetical protein